MIMMAEAVSKNGRMSVLVIALVTVLAPFAAIGAAQPISVEETLAALGKSDHR